MCGASVTGSQHVSRGLGCDDAFAYGHVGDFIVAAVADGAGSVSGTSAWGSHTACQEVVALTMRPDFIDGFRAASVSDADAMMHWVFTGARDRVVKQAEAMGLPVGLLATTLSVAIGNRDLMVLAQIGDGVIASESDIGIATHLIEEKDEYANATWFIHTDEAFEKSFRTTALLGATAFALSTDGMSYKITDIVTGEAFEPFFKGSWGQVRSGADASDFAALLRGIEDDQTGDDKTMVLAALQWADDKFYPSARPVVRTQVSSPPPPPIAVPKLAEPKESRSGGSAEQSRPKVAEPAAIAPVVPKPPQASPEPRRQDVPDAPVPPADGDEPTQAKRRHRWTSRRSKDGASVPDRAPGAAP